MCRDIIQIQCTKKHQYCYNCIEYYNEELEPNFKNNNDDSTLKFYVCYECHKNQNSGIYKIKHLNPTNDNILNLQVMCRHSNNTVCTNNGTILNGCKWKGLLKDLDNHTRNECGYRITDCPFEKMGCDISKIEYYNLAQHLQEYQIKHIMILTNKVGDLCDRVK